MKTNVFVISKSGKPLMPTKRYGHVRKLLKAKKAKVVKLRPFTIQLMYESKEFVQPLILGIDPGVEYIGAIVRKLNGQVMFAGELTTRSRQVTEKMAERKMHKQGRNRNKRLKKRRRAKKSNVSFKTEKLSIKGMEKPLECKGIKPKKIRFLNRKRKDQWLTPTANHVLQTHQNWINIIKKILPINQVYIEYAKFDIQKLENPDIQGEKYQKGILQGFANVKEFVLCRDNHTCQICKKTKIPLNVHHVIHKKSFGANTSENLITLCGICHQKLHQDTKTETKLKKIFNGINKKYVPATLLNSIMPRLYTWLQCSFGSDNVQKTYGYLTKEKRFKYELKKDHHIDAYLISIPKEQLFDKIIIHKFLDNVISFQFQQFRRHNRQLIIARRDRLYKYDNEIVARNRNKRTSQQEDSLKDFMQKNTSFDMNKLTIYPGKKLIKCKQDKSKVQFRPGDLIKFHGSSQIHVVKGSGSKNTTVFLVGRSKYVLAKKCHLVLKNTGIVCL